MLSWNDLSFEDKEEKVIVTLYKYFYKEFSKEEIEELGECEIKENKLKIKKLDESASQKKFMRFFRKYKQDLLFKINGNKAIFVDEDIELPLIGLNFLGILDKGSEILEIKPITGCNAGCNFCSVNEGFGTNKEIDFVVDKDYLVNETKVLLSFKQTDNISLWLNPHGDPTLYSKLVEYCEEVIGEKYVKDIHIITNGLLLSKIMVDELVNVSKKHKKSIHISLSMSGIDNAKKMMGPYYNLDLVLKNLDYALDKLTVIITPVWVHGMNDKDVKKLVLFAKEKKVNIAIQKFCKNKRGRNPVKEVSWDKFFKDIKELEKETKHNLTQELGKIKETNQLPLICNKKEKINVKVVCSGRRYNDGLGVLENSKGRRAVALIGCDKNKKMAKAIVLSNKYNMILAKC